MMLLLCVVAVVVGETDPHLYHPHYHHPYHHYPYHHYHHPYHHHYHPHPPLKGHGGVAKHPGGATSYVAPRVHGLGKRSADPQP